MRDNAVQNTVSSPEPILVEEFPTFDCKTPIAIQGVHSLKLVLAESLLPGWHKFPLHPKIMMALHEKGFESPTAIQAASLPFALADRDVVGVAQTVWLIAVSKFNFFDTRWCTGFWKDAGIWFAYSSLPAFPTKTFVIEKTLPQGPRPCTHSRIGFASLISSQRNSDIHRIVQG